MGAWIPQLAFKRYRSGMEMTQVIKRLRIGVGHDTHRLQAGGPLRIGGIDVPCDKELVGYSDADVLLHAVTDALLGASALSDIGELFPNNDEANKNRDSGDMLQRVTRLIRDAGFEIINVDCIIFAQQPKFSPFKSDMQLRVAELLGVDSSQVGIKAKTGEQDGPVGEGLAMQAECVALLYRGTAND